MAIALKKIWMAWLMRPLGRAMSGILKVFKPFLCHQREAILREGALLQVTIIHR